MTTLERDGLALHYEVHGPDDAPPVLFVHGVTGSGWAEWRRLLPLLEADYRCIVPDLRGHARSDFRAEGYTTDALAADVLAVADAEGVEHPHAVGFSMGTSVLIEAERLRPGWATSMVLLGPSTGAPPGQMAADPDSWAPPTDWPRSLRRLHEARHGPDHWAVIFRLFCIDWATRPQLSDEDALALLGLPTLIVQGGEEVEWKRRQVERLETLLPDAEVHVVPGAGHPVHQERADVVNPLVVEFLARVTGRAAI